MSNHSSSLSNQNGKNTKRVLKRRRNEESSSLSTNTTTTSNNQGATSTVPSSSSAYAVSSSSSSSSAVVSSSSLKKQDEIIQLQAEHNSVIKTARKNKEKTIKSHHNLSKKVVRLQKERDDMKQERDDMKQERDDIIDTCTKTCDDLMRQLKECQQTLKRISSNSSSSSDTTNNEASSFNINEDDDDGNKATSADMSVIEVDLDDEEDEACSADVVAVIEIDLEDETDTNSNAVAPAVAVAHDRPIQFHLFDAIQNGMSDNEIIRHINKFKIPVKTLRGTKEIPYGNNIALQQGQGVFPGNTELERLVQQEGVQRIYGLDGIKKARIYKYVVFYLRTVLNKHFLVERKTGHWVEAGDGPAIGKVKRVFEKFS